MVTRREHFRKHMHDLENDVLELGTMVRSAMLDSVEALRTRNVAVSESLVKADLDIDKKRWEIEDQGIIMIATQQPVAKDLREIISLLSIIVDLERMGDHAEGIARINILMGDEPLLKPLVDIPRMAEIAADMLERSLAAFVAKDADAARAISKEDDKVDDIYNSVYQELLTYMIEDPQTIERATYLLWTAHNLERIADRVTNICERVVFLKTGRLGEIEVSKY